MKKILFVPILLLFAIAGHTEVTHLKIVPLAGTESASALAQIGKIVLGNDQMCLYGHDGAELGCTPFSQIGKIVFYNGASALDDIQAETLQVFVDPTQDVLFVRGIGGKQTVRVYSMQGQLICSAEALNGEANISVSGLQNGTYLLQAGAQVVKFIKE